MQSIKAGRALTSVVSPMVFGVLLFVGAIWMTPYLTEGTGHGILALLMGLSIVLMWISVVVSSVDLLRNKVCLSRLLVTTALSISAIVLTGLAFIVVSNFGVA